MRINSLLIFTSLLLGALPSSLKAQCTGNRYHDSIFSEITITSDIVYGNNLTYNNLPQDLKLDVYEPKGDTASLRALIIFAHGGSFIIGSKTGPDVVPPCTDFAKLGYVTASIDYRLLMTNLSAGSIPDSTDAGAAIVRAVQDARAAVRFFRRDVKEKGNTYRIDTNEIFFAGVSSGGFIALHLAYMDEPNEFPSYIDTTGITVGNKIGQPGLHGGLEGLSGNTGYSSKVKAIIIFSGALTDTSWMHAGDTPLISTHGIGDGVVPFGTGTIYLQPPATFPIQVVNGSSSVAARANHLGIVNCFKAYDVNNHVPEINSAYYDTSLVLVRNFLEHFTCGTPLNCDYPTEPLIINNAVSEKPIINIFPNPAHNATAIDLSKLSNRNITIELYNALGIKVRSITNISADQYTITRNDLPCGIYSVNIISENILYSKKIILE